MSERDVDLLVLGGGVIGLSCALELLAAGRQVTVLEQGLVGAGSSHGNCGALTPSHAPPLAMPGVIPRALRSLFTADAPLRIAPRLDLGLLRWLLAFAGRCTWRDFEAATRARAPLLVNSRHLLEDQVARERLDCEFSPSGTLYVFREEATLEHAAWLPRALAEVGIPLEQLDGKALAAREPALLPGMAGAFWNPLDAVFRPDRYVAELARLVRARGGTIAEHTRADAVERSGGRLERVHAGPDAFRPRQVVLALGAWSPTLGRQLGLRLPIQPGKGYSLTYTRPALAPRVPLILEEDSVCVTAWGSGYRLGSTMEFAGYDTSLNPVRLEALRRGAARALHQPEGPALVESWYGWRPMTPDDVPIIGPAPGVENLTLATGHGMMGMSMANMTGKLVAELVVGAPPSIDPAPYAASRFG
jgi:D-amino-acid dehydrogenase